MLFYFMKDIDIGLNKCLSQELIRTGTNVFDEMVILSKRTVSLVD